VEVTYVELHEGESTLTASLSPDEWTSVFGQRGAEVPNERMLALRSAARSPAMAFMSRAGTPVLSLSDTQFRNDRYHAIAFDRQVQQSRPYRGARATNERTNFAITIAREWLRGHENLTPCLLQ
jgi:hypothetical protein